MRKYLERNVESPGILHFKEKHGDRHFICNTRDDYLRAALHMLERRAIKEEKYWYWDNEERNWLSEAKEIVAASDGERAYEFLDERSDYEYEYVEVITPDEY